MSAADTPPADDHLLATLSEDERAALAEHEEDLKAVAAENKGDDEDVVFVDLQAAGGEAAAAAAAAPAPTEAAAAPAAAPAASPAAAEAPAAPAPAPAEAQAETEAVDDELIIPAFKAELPADFNDKVKALDERESAAEQRLEDGEIDRAEHRRLMREIAEERKPLERLQIKVELAAEMHEQQVAEATKAAAGQVIALAKTQGLDYTTDDAKWGDLTGFAKQLEARHPDKGPKWVLNEAHKRVLALHDIKPAPAPAPSPAPAPAPAAAATPAPSPTAAALAARKPDLAQVPQSLAQVPGGEGPGDVHGEFADIMALSGEAFEAAIARMTPAQRERFEQVG